MDSRGHIDISKLSSWQITRLRKLGHNIPRRKPGPQPSIKPNKCECGRPGIIRKNSCWVCANCHKIEEGGYEDYHIIRG